MASATQLAAAVLNGRTPTLEEAKSLIEALRYKIDMKIVNDFNEHVWLGPALGPDGKRVGITDCCFVSDPCDHHAGMGVAR